MRFRTVAAALSLSFLGAFGASADVPAGGIGGIAVSPDGSTVLTAADSRVIYVMDASTMEVTDRVYTGTTVVWMTYRQDGAAYIMRDTSGLLSIHDAKTHERLWSVDRTETADYAPAANVLAFTVRENRINVAKVIDATSFEEKGTFELGEKFYPVGQGISLDGLRMVVLARGDKRESEEKARPDNSLKGVERSTFRQQHDQRGAQIAQIDLATGNVNMTESWYQTGGPKGLVVGPTDAYVLAGSEEMARIDSAGDVEIFDSGARSHYGATMLPSLDTVVSGSLREITVKKMDAQAAQKYKLDSLPGWPEYVVRFAHTPDGKVLAGTTGYRVIVMDPAAGTTEAHTVY